MESYWCQLDAAGLEKARKELNEDPRERLSCVQTLKDWLEREKWIRSSTDTHFLLAFLRHKKFSQLGARAVLQRFWTARTERESWLKCVDPASEPKLKIIRDSCVYVPLPGRDREGRKVVIVRMGGLDTSGKTYTIGKWMNASMAIFDSMLFTDEHIQVNGFVWLVDFTGVTRKLQTFFGLENLKKYTEITVNAYPARVKQIHFYNLGPVFNTIFSIIKPIFTPKLQRRIFLHETLVTVYDHIDQSVLPDEYLPDDYTGKRAGNLKQIMENFIQENILEEKHREFLEKFYSEPYGVDLTMAKQHALQVPGSSYRKLSL